MQNRREGWIVEGEARGSSHGGGDLLGGFRDREIAGGTVYDALIAEAAHHAGARSLVT